MEYLIDEPGLVKPAVQLVNRNGNIFSIIGRIAVAWERLRRPDIAKELKGRLFECHSYDGPGGSLELAQQYCDEDAAWGSDEDEEDWNPYENGEDDDAE